MTEIPAAIPKYTPYLAGSSFVIGLSAIDPKRWLEPDDDLSAFLSEKRRLLATEHDTIFQEVEGSEAGQRECLALVVDHLLQDHPGLCRRIGDRLEVGGHSVDLASGVPPLITAGSLVQDDLVILSKRDDGWNLVAGYVAFPSSWSLREKVGHPMEIVHADVPGFSGGTRNATMINRIFDNLQPDLPAVRMNWSIYPEGELFWPPERGARHEGRAFTASKNFIRVERQALRRLPVTGDIVFTIRIYSDPIASLSGLPNTGEVADGLRRRLEEFTPEQLAYKGMVTKKDALVAYLATLAAGNSADLPAS
jgi:dimethylamine monooxygenase subunit A